jgi:hypothetical protein
VLEMGLKLIETEAVDEKEQNPVCSSQIIGKPFRAMARRIDETSWHDTRKIGSPIIRRDWFWSDPSIRTPLSLR